MGGDTTTMRLHTCLEASLFCADLFRMYEKVCSKKKWQIEIISISKSDAGGFKEVIFLVNGDKVPN